MMLRSIYHGGGFWTCPWVMRRRRVKENVNLVTSNFIGGRTGGLILSFTTLLIWNGFLQGFGSGVLGPRVEVRGIGSVQGIIDGNSEAFLGIPFAKPPIGNLRFMPPERLNGGWNSTLLADSFGPNCLQPTARGRTSENCLFLNIWTPVGASQSGRRRSGSGLFPVVIFIGGDLYTFFDSSLFGGAEIVQYDLILVTFNYRLGVFGFFSLEDMKAGGNMGLLDQYLAIEWVHENIREFGGDPGRVSLMGHSAGAASALFHMTSPRAAGRFQSVILMSGSSLAPWAMGYRVREASLRLAHQLSCGNPSASSTSTTDQILHCLRGQDPSRISQASYHIFEAYNGTDVFGPVIDTFLPKDLQYISHSPWIALERGDFPRIPVITGISAKDGILMIRRRSQLYRMSPIQLKDAFENELIPQMLERSRLKHNWMIVKEVVKFAFITGAANETGAVMDQMLDFFTEANFLAPHIYTAQFLSKHANPVYSYVFDQETPDPHVYLGAILNSTGAWHGSILLYLFGRSSFLDQIGRDFSGPEREVSQRVQDLWTSFARTGVPGQRQPSQSERSLTSWTQWVKFTPEDPIHYWLKDGHLTPRGYQPYRTQFWTEFLPHLDHIGIFSKGSINGRLGGGGGASSSTSVGGISYSTPLEYTEGASPAYKSATWILLGLVMILVGILLLVLSVLRRRRKVEQIDFESRETTPTGSRSQQIPSPHPPRRARVQQDQGVTILY